MEEGLLYYQLRGQKATSMKKIEGGLSNRTYLINETEVLRIKEPSDPYFYKPSEEKKILEVAIKEGLAPKLFAFDEKTGNLVSEYVSSSSFLGPTTSIEDTKKVISLLEKLHQSEGSFVPFDLWGRYAYYEKESGEPAFPNEERLLDRTKRMLVGEKLVLCHNDVVAGNVLKNSDGSLSLIDYEFAGLNYPEFDLASLYSENGLSESVIASLLPKSDEKTRLLIKVANRLWFYWAKWRYLKTGNQVFLLIAEEKKAAVAKENH
jgi:thiamine kinase-like enzyme